MDIKEVFEKSQEPLTYEKFTELAGKAKFADLTEGGYVSKDKHENELSAKDNEIATLNQNLSDRDKDLKDLKKQLEDAGTDNEKLTELTNNLSTLQGKYDADTKTYKEQLQKQAYEFAVKEFASTQNFSSNAAKRDFIQSMIAEDLKYDSKDGILGAKDFAKKYAKENADAFIVEAKPQEAEQQPTQPKPQFVGSTPGMQSAPQEDSTKGFSNAFHFTGVRPMPKE